jgi:hypothetical protein
MQSHGASWGCTWEKGCYTYILLMQVRPHKKTHKKQQFVRKTVRPTCTFQVWCILRMHHAYNV